MIIGSHLILYSRDADADRAFIRDVLGFPHVDAGDGWLIFKAQPAELAVHPVDDSPRHELYLMCDDIDETVGELKAKDVRFAMPVTDFDWGRVTMVLLPGGGQLGIYEPRHPTAYNL